MMADFLFQINYHSFGSFVVRVWVRLDYRVFREARTFSLSGLQQLSTIFWRLWEINLRICC